MSIKQFQLPHNWSFQSTVPNKSQKRHEPDNLSWKLQNLRTKRYFHFQHLITISFFTLYCLRGYELYNFTNLNSLELNLNSRELKIQCKLFKTLLPIHTTNQLVKTASLSYRTSWRKSFIKTIQTKPMLATWESLIILTY